MSEAKHIPVLLNEILEMMFWPDGRDISIADLTVGGGGHLRALLEKNPRPSKIVAFDQDLETLNATREKLKSFEPIEWRHENFRALKTSDELFDRILIDLGVSSFQLDDPHRGFSFQKDGPLDMRMDSTRGEPAWSWLAHCSEEELKQILRDYGEDPKAGLVARKWVNARKGKEIRTTAEFVRALGFELDSKTQFGRHPLTKVFQAIRIFINDEVGALEDVLESLPKKLKLNGRVAILTFHSLEDRAVKWSLKGKLKPINKKVIQASPEEQRLNPRSRSAKLRVYERSDRDVDSALENSVD